MSDWQSTVWLCTLAYLSYSLKQWAFGVWWIGIKNISPVWNIQEALQIYISPFQLYMYMYNHTVGINNNEKPILSFLDELRRCTSSDVVIYVYCTEKKDNDEWSVDQQLIAKLKDQYKKERKGKKASKSDTSCTLPVSLCRSQW